jgi:Synergist-CTERM protein sorting domain-containing protein
MTRRLAVLACLAGVPALASAQTIIVTESTDRDSIINIAECSNQPPDRLAFTWTPTTTATAFDLYASDQASCPPPGQTVNGVSTNAHTGAIATGITQTSRNQGDTAATVLNLAQIACQSSKTSLFLCVFATGTTTNPLATGTVQLDLVAPPAPTLTGVTPGDGSLTVSWAVGLGSADGGTLGSANSFRVYYTPTDGSSGEKFSTFTGAGTTSGRVTGLTNGVVYDVTVTALTIGSNESARSNQLSGTETTPIQVQDFWRLYQNSGGREQGGCATGAAGLAALAALTPLVLRKRRSRS